MQAAFQQAHTVYAEPASVFGKNISENGTVALVRVVSYRWVYYPLQFIYLIIRKVAVSLEYRQILHDFQSKENSALSSTPTIYIQYTFMTSGFLLFIFFHTSQPNPSYGVTDFTVSTYLWKVSVFLTRTAPKIKI